MTSTEFRPKSPSHQLVDHRLHQLGHPPLRDLVTGSMATDSWETVTRWIEATTGESLSTAAVWAWFRGDTEVQTARAAARQAKAS